MHRLSRKELNSAELETARVSESPTTVVTANGEVQTKDEATVYVKELDLFVPVKLLEDTPAVLSLGKLCEDHGYSQNSFIMADEYNALRRTTCRSLSLVHRLALPAQLHLHLQHHYRRSL